MYLEHFGLREYPFSLTPDTAFFLETASHCDALNVLCAALRSGEGFVKVTAEVGLGKTLLCRLLLRRLGEGFVTAYLPDPQLSPRALRVALAEELTVSLQQEWTDEQLMRRIRDRLLHHARLGKRVVLLIDEAHQLPGETLESVRLLTNLETEKTKLLQVVVCGQPELDRRLAGNAFRQLRQRITFSSTLEPLDARASAAYVAHRLRVAGSPDGAEFGVDALAAVHRASGGTPRLVNVVCHKALLAAFGAGVTRVRAAHVRRAIADTGALRTGRLAGLLAWRPRARFPALPARPAP